MKFNTNRSLINYTFNETAEMNLICFANAGAGPTVFRQWNEAFNGVVNVWGASYPGRDTLSQLEPVHSLEALISIYAEELSFFSNKPFLLYGHSFGALVAYSLAVKLQDSGVCTVALCVGARRPPFMNARGALDFGSDQRLLDQLKKLKGIPDVLLENEELLEYYLPHIKHDLLLNESCIGNPVEKLVNPIFGFYSSSDLLVLPSEVEGWSVYTEEYFEPISVTGGHFFIKDKNNAFFREMMKIIDKSMSY